MVGPAQGIIVYDFSDFEASPHGSLLVPAPDGFKVATGMDNGGNALGSTIPWIARPYERRHVSAAHDGLAKYVDAVVKMAHFRVRDLVGGCVAKSETDAVLYAMQYS